MTIPAHLQPFFDQLTLPKPDSHKGQNGKLLIIGGSELFHAASRWSLDIASKFVDMVFYSSIPSNNELIQAAKGQFWNGMVIDRDAVDSYLEEADAVLIGPGMTRSEETQQITNELLSRYPHKKWVIDAGALQMMRPSLLTASMILTPHEQELTKVFANDQRDVETTDLAALSTFSRDHQDCTIVLKGQVDRIATGSQEIEVPGGNAGMTKGGTGDVLAGLIAALYCRHQALTAAVVGSFVNKAAGDHLYTTVGPFFNASDLVGTIPQTLWQLVPKD